MSGLLRCGKFIRLVSGISRQPLNNGTNNSSNNPNWPQQQQQQFPVASFSTGSNGLYQAAPAAAFVECGGEVPVIPQEIHAIPLVQVYDGSSGTIQYQPLPDVCQMFRMQGRYWDLEQLLATSANSYTPQDRKSIFLCTLQSYADHGLYAKAILLSRQLVAEGLAQDFDAFHDLMAEFGLTVFNLNDNSSVISTNTPQEGNTPALVVSPGPQQQSWIPATPAESCISEVTPTVSRRDSLVSSVISDVRMSQRVLKKALADQDVHQAHQAYCNMQQGNKSVNVTESSALVELLVKNDMISEATQVTEDMLNKDTYPLPKIFRFLLNKMAVCGEVDMMEKLGNRLSAKVKKEVSFDNRLCNAYLSAGKGAEFLKMLQRELAKVNDDNLQSIKDKFPRGGAMGLLEHNPELLEDYSKLAHKFIELDYVAPMNVLWTYYFINGRHAEAEPLWHKYVKNCPQIMFQKICQTARSKGSEDMARRLVDLLQGANVTSGAHGIAYSCLLDVMTQKGDFQRALQALEEGVRQRGLNTDNVNRTALVRLKNGLAEMGLESKFQFEIPKKIKNENRCATPNE